MKSLKESLFDDTTADSELIVPQLFKRRNESYGNYINRTAKLFDAYGYKSVDRIPKTSFVMIFTGATSTYIEAFDVATRSNHLIYYVRWGENIFTALKRETRAKVATIYRSNIDHCKLYVHESLQTGEIFDAIVKYVTNSL